MGVRQTSAVLLQQKLSIMNLNPLSTNYIHNLPFNRQKSRQNFNKNNRTTTPIKNNKPTQPQRIEKYDYSNHKNQYFGFKSVQFTLQQPRTTSHLVYTKQGYIFALTKREGKIEKRSIIVFPDGTFANCYIQGGRLNGWAVLCKKDSFYNIFQYKGSKLEGDQYIYDIKCGIMLRSNYINGRLNSIYKCSAQNQTKFQKFVNNKLVYNLLVQTLDCIFLKNYFPSIECTMGTYYGCKRGEIPQGVGLLVTDEQIFYGQFQEGLLCGYGTISYKDGNSYVGQLQSGLTRGIGHYNTNGRIIYKYNQTTVNQEIFQEYFELKSWEEDQQLKKFYAPIISFYLKLRKIEMDRKVEPENNQLSLVDVQMGEAEEQAEQDAAQRKDSSSPAQTDRAENVHNYKRNQLRQQKEESGVEANRNPLKQNDFRKSNIQVDDISKIKIQIHEESTSKKQQPEKPKKPKGKLNKKTNRQIGLKQSSNPLLTDNEWQQIIEQLQAEQTVGREDAFLQPEKQSVHSQQVQIHPKGNPLNSRLNRVDLTKIKKQDNLLESQQQSIEDRKIRRVLPKTANKI